jgi:hypothetical protein
MKILIALGLCAGLASATTLIPHSLQARAQESDQIAVVQVLSFRLERGADGKSLKTVTRVAVGERLKGISANEIDIVQLGGQDGLRSSRIPGDADFVLGETALVFLKCKASPNRCGLVAFSEGKIELSGDSARVHDMFTDTWRQLKVTELFALIRSAPVGVGVTP